MTKIKTITAREIIDSRGNPTVEASVTLENGVVGTASCPSGASIGKYEAVELRDKDVNRFKGMGVLTAISNVQTIIAPQLKGREVEKQQEIDNLLIQLDGTGTMSKLGANASLAVSMAVTRAGCQSQGISLFPYLRNLLGKSTPPSLPTPLFNLINGGKHAEGSSDFQEFIVIPATSKKITDSLYLGITVYHALHDLLKQKNYTTLVGDEGGFAPTLKNNTEGFELLKQGIQAAGFELGRDVFLGMDAASNSFYKNKAYLLRDKQKELSTDDLVDYYKELNNQYHLLYLEDPLSEDDWKGWTRIQKELSGNTIIVGDDLITTNPKRLQMALEQHTVGGVVIKPNQIGTLTQTMAVHEMAKASGLKTIVSHRSGETTDDFIADLAVALSSDYIKCGAPARGERTAKYNRLLKIEQELQTQ